DASVLATLADGLLIVARAHHTRTQQLRATVEELAQSGRPIAGIIINRVASREAYYYYGRGYGRVYGEGDGAEPRRERLRVGDLTDPKEAEAASGSATNGSRWGRGGDAPGTREPVAATVEGAPAESEDDEVIGADAELDREPGRSG
ncbi:MAG: hypothetical protein AB7G21_00485, partial [Dehalococcoidia bacterium]